MLPLLLLAQLVLPSPPSGPIQPPGMICMGECDGGPAVWRTSSDRGKLVVACDMRSDTCSDGRQITTERATPVPCEVSPGVWEIIGPDEGCYSVRGLESWGATTSYLSYGAELDRSPWVVTDGAHLEGRILSGPTGSARLVHTGITPSAGTWTLACRLRALEGETTRLRIYQQGGTGGSTERKTLARDWITVSQTFDIGGTPTQLSAHIYPDGSTLEIAGCWLTKTATPGRACWGGEAPVHCAADGHTISTEGWPTMHGSIETEFRIDETPQRFAIILDGRSGDTTGFNIHYDSNTGRLNHRQDDRVMAGPTITLGTWYRVRLEREGVDTRMYVNGVLVAEESDWPAWSYPNPSGVAILGRHYTSLSSYLNGPIRSLRIRSYEEVSP